MNKFLVLAYDENECWVMYDKTTNEPFLHVPDESLLAPVTIEANSYDEAVSLFYKNGNYSDDIQIGQIATFVNGQLEYKNYNDN